MLKDGCSDGWSRSKGILKGYIDENSQCKSGDRDEDGNEVHGMLVPC